MSTVNISLISVATGKTQQVSLPRDMTVTDMQALAGKNISFAVDGCTVAGSATLGDLYDLCAKQEVLEVAFGEQDIFGCTPCWNCTSSSDNSY